MSSILRFNSYLIIYSLTQLKKNTWFERISMMVILLNCITLGMYQPCVDDKCVTNRCKILQVKKNQINIMAFSMYFCCLKIIYLHIIFGFSNGLQMFDDIIFTFFSLEMTIKMVAMGIYGKGTYLADSWNRLDCFIVAAG